MTEKRPSAAAIEQFQFKPGQSGNPNGRPKGSRHKLSEAFLCDLMDDWAVHGKKAIEKVRATKPSDYLKVVASILPKELNVKVNDLDDLSDEQLARQFASIAAQLTAAGFGIGEGDPAAQQAQPAAEVPTLQ